MGIRKVSNKILLQRMRDQIKAIHKKRVAVDMVQKRVNEGRETMKAMYNDLAQLEIDIRDSKDFEYYKDDLRKLNGLRKKLFV